MPDFTSLPDAALLALLRTEEDRLPLAGAAEIVRRMDRLEPTLIAMLGEEDLWLDEDKSWWALLHAVQLLALGGRPSAFESVLDAIRTAYDDDLDWIWVQGTQLLAAFGPLRGPDLASLFHDAEDNDSLRSCYLEALAIHAAHGGFDKQAVFLLAADALRSIDASRELKELAGIVLGVWVAHGAEPEVLKCLGLGRQSAKKRFSEIWKDAQNFVETPEEWFQKPDLWRFYSQNAIAARTEKNRTFGKSGNPSGEFFGLPGDDEDESGTTEPEAVALGSAFPVHLVPKPGRNDACPCGSGKKFKKCCEGKQ